MKQNTQVLLGIIIFFLVSGLTFNASRLTDNIIDFRLILFVWIVAHYLFAWLFELGLLDFLVLFLLISPAAGVCLLLYSHMSFPVMVIVIVKLLLISFFYFVIMYMLASLKNPFLTNFLRISSAIAVTLLTVVLVMIVPVALVAAVDAVTLILLFYQKNLLGEML